MRVHCKFLSTVVLALAIAASVFATPAVAATYTWDSSGAGTTFDGAGTWSTTSAYWWTGGPSDIPWTTSGTDSAVFGNGGAGPYTVTVPGTVGVGGITFNSGSSYNVSGGTIALGTASPTITTNAASATIGSVIAGSTGLVLSGGGNLLLTGSNVYTGGTAISSGVTTISNYSALSSGPVSLAGGTLRLASPTPGAGGSIGINFVGGGGSVSGSDGVVAMTGWNNLSGSQPSISNLNNNSGVGTGATITTSNPGNTANSSNPGDALLYGYIYAHQAQISVTISNIPYSNYSLYAYSADSSPSHDNELTMAGTNFYFLGTNTSSFTQITTTSPPSTYTAGNYAVVTGQTATSQTVTVNTTNSAYTGFSGFEIVNTTPASGLPNAVTLSSNSTIDVSGYASGVVSGSFTIGSNQLNVTGSGAGVGTAFSLTLGATGGVTLVGNPSFNVANNSGGVGTLVLGALNDSGSASTIAINGGGAVTLGTAAAAMNAGDTVNITGGTLNSNNATALGTLTTVSVASGATLSLGAGQTLAALTDYGTPVVNGAGVLTNGNALTVGGSSNFSSTFSGVIGGGGSLVKAGAGMLTLAGANTYSGATTISAGTLQIGSGGSTGAIGSTSGITDNAMLAFDRSDNGLSIAAAISGSGTLANIGGGMTTLTKQNSSFTGNVNISTGTLAINAGLGFGGGNGIFGLNSPTITIGSGAVLWNEENANGSYGGLLSSYNFAINGGTLNTGATGLAAGNPAACYSEIDSVTMTGGNFVGGARMGEVKNAVYTIQGGTAATNTIGANLYLYQTASNGTSTNLTFNVAPSTTLLYSGDLLNNTDGWNNANVVLTGSGTMILSGANTYLSPTIISSGTIQVGNGGASGNLGAGAVSNSGVLIFNRSDSALNVPVAISGSGSVIQIGSGGTTLSASNTYNGGTTINAGTLALGSAGSINNSPTISLANGATFDVSQVAGYHLVSGQTLTGMGNCTVNGAMTANSGSVILPGGVASSGTLNVGGLTLSPGSIVNYDIGGGSQDLINVTNGGGLNVSGGSIGLYQANGTTQFSTPGTYTLINYTGAISGAAGNLTISDPNPIESYSFIDTGSAVELNIAFGSFWNGGGNPVFNWSNSANWSSLQAPASDTALVFSGSQGLTNNNDIVNLSLTGLSFSSSAGAFNLSGNSIQLSGAIANDSTATQTIGLNIGLSGGNESFNAAAGNIVVNGTISDGGAGLGIGKTGSGTLTLTASNTYSGGTVLSAGVLQVANNNSLGSGPIALNGGAITSTGTGGLAFTNAFSLGGNSGLGDPVNNGAISFSGAGAITTANPQLTVNSPVAISGAISDGGNGWTILGPSLLTLTGSNAITGTTTVSGGTLQLNTSGAPALNGNLAVSGGTVQVLQSNQLAGASSVSVSAGLLNIGANSNAVAGLQVTGGTIAGTTGVLTSSSDYDAQNGAVSAILGGNVNLNKTTTGTVVLSAANTYSGSTSVTAGTLTLAHSLAVQNSTVSVGSGGALGFSQGITAPSLGGLAGNGNIALATIASEPVTLNVGSNGQSTIYGGALSGAGGLVKQGVGTLTLNALQSYSGATAVSGGVLQLQPLPAGGSIGVHFEGNDGSTVNSPAGAYSMSNWNNIVTANMPTNTNITNYPLTDNSNANTLVTLSTSNQTWGIGQSGSSVPLLDGYIYINTGGVMTTTFNNIPYSSYDLYAYVVDSSSGHNQEITIGGATYYLSTVGGDSSYQQATSTSPGSPTPGDYVVATGLTGATQTVGVQGVGTIYGTFAGFEIVNTSPSTTSILPATTPVTISNGATLDMTNLTQTILSLSSTDGMGSQVLLGYGSLTIAGTAVTTFDGVISGGGGSLTLQGGGLTLTGSNTFSGATTVSSGTLQVGAGGSSALIGATSGVTLGNGAAIVFNHSDNVPFAPAVTGSGSLTQTGPGVLTLESSSNSYTGGTTINGGGIQLGGLGGLLPVLASSAAGGLGGAVTITAGTLDLNGQAQTVGALDGSASALITDTQSGGTAGSNGTTPLAIDFDSGSSNYGGTIADGPTAYVSLTKEGAGTLILSGTNTYSGGTIVSEGTLQLNDSEALAEGSSLTVGDASAFGGVLPAALPIVAAVPEPGTLILLGAACLMLVMRRTVRRR